MDKIFNKKDLPLADLEKLGLYSNGHFSIDKHNLDALLEGRRTDMVTLHNLKAEGIRIASLDARLSLAREPDGTLSLKLHPIYKEAQQHDMLLNHEAEELISGKIDSVEKSYYSEGGKPRSVVIEYDKETREFVSYDPDQVTAPHAVNNHALSSAQKEAFSRGKSVELPDGTILQHRASEGRGLLSNRSALVLSVLLDGGISYLLYTGIKNLFGSENKQLTVYTKGYEQALADMEKFRQQEYLAASNNGRVSR